MNSCRAVGMIDEDAIRYRWETVGSKLDELWATPVRGRRVENSRLGGLAAVARVAGLARSTINRCEGDFDGEALIQGPRAACRWWAQGVSTIDPGLVPALQRLVEPACLAIPCAR